MRIDERSAGVAREHAMLLVHQNLPARKFSFRPRACRELLQLAPALVVFVDRIEERLRLGSVNQDRDLELPAHLEKFVIARIVPVDALASAVLSRHTDTL